MSVEHQSLLGLSCPREDVFGESLRYQTTVWCFALMCNRCKENTRLIDESRSKMSQGEHDMRTARPVIDIRRRYIIPVLVMLPAQYEASLSLTKRFIELMCLLLNRLLQ